MPEIAVILVVALVVLGPRRLPEMARTLGKGLAEFRKVTGDVNKELQSARDLIEREAREHERIGRQESRNRPETASPAPSNETKAAGTPEADEAIGNPAAEPGAEEVAAAPRNPGPNPAPKTTATSNETKVPASPPSNTGGSQADS